MREVKIHPCAPWFCLQSSHKIMKDIMLPQIYGYDHVGVHALLWLNHLGKLPVIIVSTIESIKQW